MYLKIAFKFSHTDSIQSSLSLL